MPTHFAIYFSIVYLAIHVKPLRLASDLRLISQTKWPFCATETAFCHILSIFFFNITVA